jgi:putative ABC transport system permease protein
MRPGFRLVAGRTFRPGRYEVIVGRRLARDVAGLAIGETVTGSARDWEIVGTFENGGSLDESEVWSDLEAARTENGGRASVSSIRVPLSPGAGLQELRAALAANPQVQLRTVVEREYQAEISSALVRRVRALAVALAVLLGVGAIVAMINTTYSAIAARERYVSTLRAIGFGGAPAATAVFAESLLLGLVGGIVGGLVAFALANGWGLSLLNTETHTPLALEAAVTWSSLAYGVLGGVVLGALAAVLPSINVARTDVVASLR